ncbi:Putative U-box domain-containing protein [Candidatus Bealeia paramacronuclearis]|uniref:U-box domain-containing protein n=1 Tax=Candidatus Bealeia paramacronuclearis TaxID=1921001 RepID=A0ABZ2C7N4_9PROT|nr:putative U-box domain-containing protein [Candidatus Bealeia paramacronuclearis]
MVFTKKSLLAMCALTVLSCQPVQAAKQGEEEKSSSLTMKPAFLQAPREIGEEILKYAFISSKTDITNFREIGTTLSLVCKDWNKTIAKNAKKWVCDYFNINKKDEDVFWRFFKGKLIYTDPQTNAQTVLPISSLPNPLSGEFDLSKCGKTGEDLSINVGYRKVHNQANTSKIEIWFTPTF